MEVELATINQFLADMLLPFMRISGLFVAMIGLSAKSIPPQVRALLGIMLTLVIMPVVPPSPIELSECRYLFNCYSTITDRHRYWFYFDDGIEHLRVSRADHRHANRFGLCFDCRPG